MSRAFVSYLPSFQSRRSSFTGKRCSALRKVNRVQKPRAVHTLVAVIEPFNPGTLLIAKDITRRIFLGGLSIILSGIVGVAITAYLVNRNFDALEEDFQNRDGAIDRRRALDELREREKNHRG